MKHSDIVQLIKGKALNKPSSSVDYVYAFASDLMSDVLTIRQDNVLLITGLTNTQTVRTAEMADIYCIIIGRGKCVTDEMLKLANDNGIAIISSPYSVFRISGLLFQAGINPVF